jgi:PPOX class probable F420-dependent enzyme
VDEDGPAASAGPLAFGVLEGHRYARLTTFRRNGYPVSTPVWFALVGDRIYVFTDLESGKVKRIRNDPRVTLSPSDFRGRSKGDSVRVTARVMDGGEVADRALREKYGLRYQMAQAVIRLLGKSARRAFLELRPVGEEDNAL